MDDPTRPRQDPRTPRPRPGDTAHAAGRTLTSARIAALPILERVLRRLRLEEILRDSLPREDQRSRIPTATGLLILVKNLGSSPNRVGNFGPFFRFLAACK